MHKHLIKRLSEIIKRKGTTPKRRFHDYSNVYSDVTERWLLAWNRSNNITHYIFHILIRKSVLLFLTFVPLGLMTPTISLRDPST